MLAAPLRLHDVRDVEGLCRTLLDRVLRGWGATLKPEEYDEALAFLLEVAWRQAGRYDRSKSTLSFSTFASRILERRVVDWYRKWFGDSRYGARPRVVSLEGLAHAQGRSIEEVIGQSYSDEEEVLVRASIGV